MRKAIITWLAWSLPALCVRGDMIAWNDGAVWQDVTVTAYRLADGQPQFYIEPNERSSPAGLTPGWYADAKRIDFVAGAPREVLQGDRAVSPYPPIEAAISSVIDGNTLRLDTGQKVRLLGVDAPQTTDPDNPVEFFGRESFLYTQRKVEGKRVRIEFDQRRMDNAGRLLGYLYTADGTFLNLDLVRSGHGHAWFGEPMSEAMAAQFREAEAMARSQQLGLWNVERREASRRQWQIGTARALSSSAQAGGSSSYSSSVPYTGSRGSRGRGRPITIDFEYTERPSWGWGGMYGIGGGGGRTTELTVRAR